jgi:hypothetical protein
VEEDWGVYLSLFAQARITGLSPPKQRRLWTFRDPGSRPYLLSLIHLSKLLYILFLFVSMSGRTSVLTSDVSTYSSSLSSRL